MFSDPDFVDQCFQFIEFTVSWLVGVAQESSGDLPEVVPPAFASLPEFIFRSVAEHYLFFSQYELNGICSNA